MHKVVSFLRKCRFLFYCYNFLEQETTVSIMTMNDYTITFFL